MKINCAIHIAFIPDTDLCGIFANLSPTSMMCLFCITATTDSVQNFSAASLNTVLEISPKKRHIAKLIAHLR